jgi:hypothetical protein
LAARLENDLDQQTHINQQHVAYLAQTSQHSTGIDSFHMMTASPVSINTYNHNNNATNNNNINTTHITPIKRLNNIIPNIASHSSHIDSSALTGSASSSGGHTSDTTTVAHNTIATLSVETENITANTSINNNNNTTTTNHNNNNSSSSTSMVNIIQGQRDRFKQKLVQVSALIHTLID